MKCFAAALAVILLVTTGCARQRAPHPGAIEDAQLGMRVKTALVNDPILGPRVIEVRARSGVVTLTGLVGSPAEADRAAALARAVAGVVDVRSQLAVGEPAGLREGDQGDTVRGRARPTREAVPYSSSTRNRRVAVGGFLAAHHPSNERLSSGMTLSPLVRLGVGRGLGVALGFSWFGTDLRASSEDTLGRVTLRPVMAGPSWTFNDQQHWAVSLSVVAGVAFNSFAFEASTVRDGLALDLDNSLALRPGVSLWYDLNSRAAFNIFGGYVITRPGATFLENDHIVRRALRGDAGVIGVGLVYKLF